MDCHDAVTLVIRVIRSFEFRNIRNIVLKGISLSITVEELKSIVNEKLKIAPGLPPPFRKYEYDTLKVLVLIRSPANIILCDGFFYAI